MTEANTYVTFGRFLDYHINSFKWWQNMIPMSSILHILSTNK